MDTLPPPPVPERLKNVRALVLDGALDIKLSAVEIALEQAVGFDKSPQAFFGGCGKAANNCTWANGDAPHLEATHLAGTAARARASSNNSARNSAA
jgi:hypothetical protein